MKVKTQEIIDFCAKNLQYGHADVCPNGLQVEGKEYTQHVVTGVSASRELLQAAHAVGADSILVHHGYFWHRERREITGWMHKRIEWLLKYRINLLAYHLPLDYHAQWGNNAQLAQQMNWEITGRLRSSAGGELGMIGRLATPMTSQDLADELAYKLKHTPVCISGHTRVIRTLAWCTGAAAADMHWAHQAGVDAYITGEIPENAVHIAREMPIVLYAAGHHATERFGVQALGKALAEQFGIKHTYIEIPSPI